MKKRIKDFCIKLFSRKVIAFAIATWGWVAGKMSWEGWVICTVVFFVSVEYGKKTQKAIEGNLINMIQKLIGGVADFSSIIKDETKENK